MTPRKTLRAVHVPAAELDPFLGAEDSLYREARRMIDEAHRIADELCRAVEQERAELDRRLTDLSQEELKKFLDTETVKRKAEAFVALLDASTDVSRAFAAIQPWLDELVRTALYRIVGQFDDAELVSRIVAEGVSDLNPGEAMRLRVAPDCHARAEAARDAHPKRFAVVSAISPDPSLAPGQMMLDCQSGLSNVTLDSQIDAVMAFIDCAVAGAASAGESHD